MGGSTTGSLDRARGAHDQTHRIGLQRWIASQLSVLSIDELRVVSRIVDRVRKGQEQYGRLDLSSDQRDHRAEAADELADWFWYTAMREVAANEHRAERLQCELADRAAEQQAAIQAALRDLAEKAPKPITPIDFDLGGEAG